MGLREEFELSSKKNELCNTEPACSTPQQTKTSVLTGIPKTFVWKHGGDCRGLSRLFAGCGVNGHTVRVPPALSGHSELIVF